MKKKKKKIDRIVAGVLLYYIVFVVVTWVCFFIVGDIPDTLVQVGLGGGVIELVATAAIEILSNNRRNEDAAEDSTESDMGGGITGPLDAG